eukprot:16447346-Heterocapsa_arctica.AAC.1
MAIARMPGLESETGGPTGVHAQVYMTRVLCTQIMCIEQVWSMCLKLRMGLKLRFCAKLSAFCEESNGDREDARRPFKNPPNN